MDTYESSSSSGSDIEQAQGKETLGQRQACNFRVPCFIGLGVLVVCLVGFARGLQQGPPSAVKDGVVIVSHPKLGKLSNLVQAYAISRGGHTLTEYDVDTLLSHMAENHGKARSLVDGISRAKSPDTEGQEGELGLSAPCADAIQVELKEALERLAMLMVEDFFSCVVGDEKSDACAGATTKMDSFMDDTVAKCQAEGDFCNVTVFDKVDDKFVEESLGTCVPVACHSEARSAIAHLKEELGQQIKLAEEAEEQAQAEKKGEAMSRALRDECPSCTINITCAADGKQSTQQKDAAQLEDGKPVIA